MKTLYECEHARVCGERIRCRKGYLLSPLSRNGSLDIQDLAEGKPLASDTCQQCGDFKRMGPPLPEEERGWIVIRNTGPATIDKQPQ